VVEIEDLDLARLDSLRTEAVEEAEVALDWRDCKDPSPSASVEP